MKKMPSSMALILMFGLLCCSSWAAAGLDFQNEAQFLEELHRLKPGKPGSSSQKKPMPSKAPVPIPMNNGGLVAVLNRMNLRGSSVPKFVVELMVGNPPVPLNFSIDTMGHQTAIPSQLCASSVPSSSRSSKSKQPVLPTNMVPCTHPVCKGPSFTCDRVRKRCIAFDRYSNKPLDLVTTQLTLQKVYPSGTADDETRTLAGIVVGCSNADAVAFTSTNVASLSPLPTSLVSQLSSAANLPRKFAYCLGKPRGAFFLGSADYVFRQQNITAKLQYFPMLASASPWQRGQGYKLALKGIAVGSSSSQLLPIDPAEFKKGIIIGTKARYTSLVEVAYKVVRKHFMRVAMASGPAIAQVPSPFPELNLCYRLPTRTSVTGAPKIFFTFEGNSTLTVEPRNYIVRWRNTDVVCMGIVSAGPLGRVSVIGTLQQEEMLVEFDLENNRVGISEQLTRTGNSCQYFDFTPWTYEPLPRKDGGAIAPVPAAVGASLSAPTSSQLSVAAMQASAPAPSQVSVAATPSSSRIMLVEDSDSPNAAESIQDEDSTAPIGEIIGTPMVSPVDQVATSPSYSIDQVAASPTGQSSLRNDQVAASMSEQVATPPAGSPSFNMDQVATSPVGSFYMNEQVATPPMSSNVDQVATSPVGLDQVATSPVGSFYVNEQVAASPVSFSVDQVTTSPVGSSFYMNDQVAASPVSFNMDQVATSPVGSFYTNDQVAASPMGATGQSSIWIDQVASPPVGGAYRMRDQVAPSASFRIDQVAASSVGPSLNMDQVATSPTASDQVAASPGGAAFGTSDQVATPPVGSSSFRTDQVATSPVVSSFLALDQVATSPVGAAYDMTKQVATPPVGASSLRVDQVATSPVGSSDRTDQVAPNAAYVMSEQTAAAPAGSSSFRIDQFAATSPVGSSFGIQIAASPAGVSSIYSTWDQVATSSAGSLRKGAISPVGSSFEIDQVATSPAGSLRKGAISPVGSSFEIDQVVTSPAGSLRKGAISPVGSSFEIEQAAGASSIYDQVATSPAGSLRKGAISPVGSSFEIEQVAA